jgi:hypothetical protein
MPARTVQKKNNSPDLSSLVLEKVPTGIRGLNLRPAEDGANSRL